MDQPQCDECGRFIPYSRATLHQKSDGMPLPSPVEYWVGLCERSEGRKDEAPPPTPSQCPHPARNGHHEVYGRPDGTSFCRACGAEDPDGTDGERRKAPPQRDKLKEAGEDFLAWCDAKGASPQDSTQGLVRQYAEDCYHGRWEPQAWREKESTT